MDPKAWPTSGQNVCRCCLAEGCYKDISTEYFWMGKREVYSDMLNETFDVNISFSKSGSTNSRLICEPCISRLRDASEFKKQVVDCERMFMNHLSEPGSSTMAEPLSTITPDDVKVIKVEAVKQEKDSDGDEDFADTTDFLDDDDDDEDDLDNQPLTKFATKVPKKEAVDIMDLLDNTELTIKRKAPTKTKAVPAKKAKTTTKVTAKATVSKAKTAARPKTAAATKAVVEKKKKGPKSVTWRKEKERNTALVIKHSNVTPFRMLSGKFQCAFCAHTFAQFSCVRDHNKGHEKDLSGLVFKKTDTIFKLEISDLRCSICFVPCRDLKALCSHLFEHDIKVDFEAVSAIPYLISGDEFKCAICHEPFEYFSKLNNHMNSHSTANICQHCGKGFASNKRLIAHLNMHDNKTAQYKCNKCDSIFPTRLSRDSHVRKVHCPPVYKCPECNSRFDSYRNRVKHMMEQHNAVIERKCPLCPAVFAMCNQRTKHMKNVHIKNYEFFCTECPSKFVTNSQLKNHMVKHNLDKAFACQVCCKAFARRKTLQEHMKIHANDRKYVCDLCHSSFVQKCSLDKHIKSHHSGK